MRFIEHIIEPIKLLLAWQASYEKQRIRYVVAELNRVVEEISLTYLPKTNDFAKAREHEFEAYPAFQDINKTHHNVFDAFYASFASSVARRFSTIFRRVEVKTGLIAQNH